MKGYLQKTGEARWAYLVDGKKVATVIANDIIRAGLETECLQQLENAAQLPGLQGLVLNPDGHKGFGVPIGTVLCSDTHLYPPGVGYDIKCSMSLLQTDVPAKEIVDKRVRRALIDAIRKLVPSGLGKGRAAPILWEPGIISGVGKNTCRKFDIPAHWIERCEDAVHGSPGTLAGRLEAHRHTQTKDIHKIDQLGTYGAGNHFGEATVVTVDPAEQDLAARWGLKDGCVAMLSHCGSRGFGYALARYHFKALQKHFKKWRMPHPGGDRELMYLPVDAPEGLAYLQDIALAGNFATVNHMIINAYLKQAFQEVIPGCDADLVYYISHNFVRKEHDGKHARYVHRKGATRAFPAQHHALKGTPFYETGHPILLPGNPVAGSRVMVADENAVHTHYSINHGAGRTMGRRDAKRTLKQEDVDAQMEEHDILFHSRNYPLDEAAAAYKDFEQVVASVEEAKLARTVAKLGTARFIIKGAE